MPKIDRLRALRVALYVTYAVVGTAWAASFPTSNAPLSFEPLGYYDRMARLVAAPTLDGLVNLPWWVAETGSIALFAWSAPFLLVFGPTLFSLQLAKVAWNLAGIRLLDRSFDDGRIGLLAAALTGFGCALSTTIQLSVSGSHFNILLPLGLLFWLSRALRGEVVATSRWRSAGAGAAVTACVMLMPYLGTAAFLLLVGVVVSVPPSHTRRLALPFIGGASLAFAALLPVVTRQMVPPPEHFMPTMKAVRAVTWLVASDFATYVGAPSSPLLGYAVELALAWAFVVAGRRVVQEGDRGLVGPLACAALLPVWISSSIHYQPDENMPDVLRLRQLAHVWPFLAVLLAMGVVVSIDEGAWRRQVGRAAALIAFVTMANGLVRMAGAIDVGAIGVTRHVPLASKLGSLLGTVVPKGGTLQSIHDLQAMESTPPDRRSTLAFYLPEGLLWAPFPKMPLRMAVREARSLGTDAYHDAYLEGLGFFACDGTLRSAASGERELPSLTGVVNASELGLIQGGCELGRQRSAGTVVFDVVDWPLSEHVIRRGRTALWGPLFDYRSAPPETQRPLWPWQRARPDNGARFVP